MSLLERSSALASLAQYADEARRGDGRLVLVAGEAGVGKSALVEQFECELADARWSWGGCDGLFTPRPLVPLFDIAGHLGGRLLDLCRSNASREELFSGLLEAIDEPGTLNVVVVEDVHWADEATLDLLRYLGRRVRAAKVLLVATYRDEGLPASHPLLLALGEIASHRSTRRIRLAPLTEDAVRVLAGDSHLELAELYRLTGGNPFYVTEVVRAGSGDVPPSARDAVLARAGRLDESCREVLDVAALLGARFDLPLLESVARCTDDAVDDLLRSGLLVGDRHSLRFRHEIARLAVGEAVGAQLRASIHARILTALRECGCDDDARLAFHAEAAGDPAAAVEFAAPAARRAAELGAHREAAAQYERALRCAEGTDAAMTAALCDGLAYELSLLDRWQEAAEVRERALALWRECGDRLREGDTLRRLSRAWCRLCRGSAALEAAEAALTTLTPLGPTPELSWAYANLATQRMLLEQAGPAVELAHRAQEIAESLGVPEALCDALNTAGCALATQGGDWAVPLRRALDIALAENLVEQAGRAYANLHGVYGGQRRFAAAERYYLDGVAYCDDHDITTFATCLRGERAITFEKTGRWDECVALSVTLLRDVAASPINRISPLTMQGVIRARRGEPGVWECLDDATTLADGTDEPQQIVPVRLARAEAHWLQGDVESARAEVELAAAHGDVCNPWQRGAVAVWLQRVGSARTWQGAIAEPYQLETEGRSEEAARVWQELGCPFDAAMALADADDEALLREALDAAQRLGASAFARVTLQRMRRRGIRSIPTGAQQATRNHPMGLTRREREVLDLICLGHTNAQIAAQLFISSKTVDHHVSAVLAKMGSPRRDLAAAEAVRLGLVRAGAGAGI
jgi:DNA-binding CsgD family transcriptional regulator/tetratricopeptide (TPR) repeat protein